MCRMSFLTVSDVKEIPCLTALSLWLKEVYD